MIYCDCDCCGDDIPLGSTFTQICWTEKNLNDSRITNHILQSEVPFTLCASCSMRVDLKQQLLEAIGRKKYKMPDIPF